MRVYLTHPAKSNCNSSLGSTTSPFGMSVVCLLPVFIFYLLRYIGDILVPFAQLSGGCGETRCSGRDIAWPPIRGGWGVDYRALFFGVAKGEQCAHRSTGNQLVRETGFGYCTNVVEKTVWGLPSPFFWRSLTAGAYSGVFGLRLQWSRAPKFCTFFL